MTTLWIVVANAATASILERTSLAHPPTEIEHLEHPESRTHSRDLGDEAPGHGLAGRTGLAQRSTASEREQEHFAQQIARVLKEGWDAHRYGALVVYASNPFLGELLAHLDAGVHKVLTASHSRDLTHLSPTQLQTKLQNEL